MGSVSKVFKKVTKAAKKPLSKITKGIAKGIVKVGKAVMRGVATVNKKLGPLGTIALSMAMPWALQGIGTGFAKMAATQATGPWTGFIKSIGQMGMEVGKGYRFATGKISTGFTKITSKISQSFSQIGKGNNIFAKISNGAKNLYNSAKTNFSNTFGKTGSAGKVEVFSGTADGPMWMDIEKASEGIIKGTIESSQLGSTTAGTNSGWFTKSLTSGQRSAQELVSNTINDAYKSTLEGYSESAFKFFNDVKKQSIAEGTYLNDFEIGQIVKDGGVKESIGYNTVTADGVSDRYLKTDFDITKSNDYKYSPVHNEYHFTGENTFNTGGKSKVSTISKKVKVAAADSAKNWLKDSLLTSNKSDFIEPIYAMNKDMTMETTSSGYEGTNIKGTEGGSLFAAVYGSEALNTIKNQTEKMNILSYS